MKGYKLFLLAIVPIIFAMIYPGLNYSLGFGWHTTIENESSPTTFLLLELLLFISFLYWLVDRKINHTNKYLTLSHFIMTILPLYYILWGPEFLFYIFENDLDKLLFTLGDNFFINAFLITHSIPLLGQIVFLINLYIGIWKTTNKRQIKQQKSIAFST